MVPLAARARAVAEPQAAEAGSGFTAAPRHRTQPGAKAHRPRALSPPPRIAGGAGRGPTPPPASFAGWCRRGSRSSTPRTKPSSRARGLEVGARDSAGALRSIRRALLDQLEALAGGAEGELHGFEGTALATELSGRSRDRLFAALQPFFQRFRGEPKPFGSPNEEWEQWVRFREGVDAVETAFGTQGLSTAWHSGLRLAAWNWPCKLLNDNRPAGAWASFVMFSSNTYGSGTHNHGVLLALFREAKRIAARDRTTVKVLLEQGLRTVLRARTPARAGFKLRKVTFRGNGLVSGRSLRDWDAIRDAAYSERGT